MRNCQSKFHNLRIDFNNKRKNIYSIAKHEKIEAISSLISLLPFGLTDLSKILKDRNPI